MPEVVSLGKETVMRPSRHPCCVVCLFSHRVMYVVTKSCMLFVDGSHGCGDGWVLGGCDLVLVLVSKLFYSYMGMWFDTMTTH